MGRAVRLQEGTLAALSLFVDTSVWSLLMRRDAPVDVPEVKALIRSLETGEPLVTAGIVLQELLQGFSGPKASRQIVDGWVVVGR